MYSLLDFSKEDRTIVKIKRVYNVFIIGFLEGGSNFRFGGCCHVRGNCVGVEKIAYPASRVRAINLFFFFQRLSTYK